VVSSAACPDVVGRWTWRSAGDQSASDSDCYSSHVEIIERLHCCLFWLRGCLLLYDYETCECIHWFDGTDQEVRWHSVYVPIGHGRTYLVFYGDRTHARAIVMADRLEKGGRTDLKTAGMGPATLNSILEAISPDDGNLDALLDSLLPWYFECLDRYLSGSEIAFQSRKPQSGERDPGWAFAVGRTREEPFNVTVFFAEERVEQNHKTATAHEKDHFFNILLLGPFAFPLLLPDEFMGKEVGDLSRRLGIGVRIEKALRKVASKFRARKVSLTGHSRDILWVEFCSSGRSLVATSCNAYLVKVWNYETGQCLFTIRDFQSSVFRMALGNGLLFAASERITRYATKKSSQPGSLSDDKVFVFNCGWSGKNDVGQILAGLPNSGGTPVVSIVHVSSHPTVVVSYRDGGINVYKYSLPPSDSLGSQLSISHERRINFTGSPFFSLSAGRLGEGFFAGVSPWLYWASFGETAAVTPGGEKFLAPSSEKMNCAHCGLFRGHTESKKCGGCGNVRFCGNACLKAGWKTHKAACKAQQVDTKKK